MNRKREAEGYILLPDIGNEEAVVNASQDMLDRLEYHYALYFKI